MFVQQQTKTTTMAELVPELGEMLGQQQCANNANKIGRGSSQSEVAGMHADGGHSLEVAGMHAIECRGLRGFAGNTLERAERMAKCGALMFRHSSFILLYSTLLFILLLITFCNGGKPGKKEKKKLIKNQGDDEGNANANQFLHSIQPHFEKFGTPFEPLEQEKDYIIKRNARKGNVEWRLAEIKRNMRINFGEFSMLDERNAGIEKKILAPAMTEYANCVKKLEKMKIKPNDKITKLFMLNGAITILDMKPIAGKKNAYRVKYVPEFLDHEQIMEPVPTHFCTSLFIVENNGKIGEHELVCTRIDRWTERDGPQRNIGKTKDCGHSELYDHQLDEHLVNSGAENMLEFVQIKLAMDLTKMLKRLELTDMVEKRKHKKNNQDLPTSSINSADENQIERMDPNLCIYKGFMVEYDPRKFVANWLLERLTIENASTKNQAERLKWNADPKLAKIFQPVEEDYHMAKQFKLNHGHLAGFRAHRNNDEYQGTFFYPNSVPQEREINSGYWRVIEEYALCLAGHKQSIAYVYTGPLYIPEKNENTDQWQMKYKVIGKRKMMAVPTHLFKIIFLEFTNENDGKKSFWLESLVVSNGQEEEEEYGNDEERERDQVEDDELEVEEEEEGDGIQVEVEMGNNIWYNLDKDEAEIEQMLKKSQKTSKGKEKSASEANKNMKNIESIQALVKGCQNRRYKIVYGDANSLVEIGGLLKEHRKSLTYIDKFAPHFQLLAKLPPQIRSKAYGIRFDEDKLAEFISKNEKRKDKINELAEQSTNNNEKEEKNKNEEVTEVAEATSSRKYDYAKGKSRKAKVGKMKKKQKQEGKQPTVSIHVTVGTAEIAAEDQLKVEYFEQMEKLYTEYLLNTELNDVELAHYWNSIQLHTRWYLAQSLLQKLKEKMLAEGNTVGEKQINVIQLELIKAIEDKKLLKINKEKTSSAWEDVEIFAKSDICWLIFLRESIFYTFFASSHQKSSALKKFALEFEQKRWKIFGILPEAKNEDNIFSKYVDDDGKRIAQIWMNSGDYCHQNETYATNLIFKFKTYFLDILTHSLQAIIAREMNYQQSKTLNNLLSKPNGDFRRKYEKFVEKNGSKSMAVNSVNIRLLKLLGFHLFKKYLNKFPKLVVIETQYFYTFHGTIFRRVFFDVYKLFSGYQSRKYALEEILHFFDFYILLDSISNGNVSKDYTKEIRKIDDKFSRRILFNRVEEQKKKLILQMKNCQNLENNEKSPKLGLALAQRCVLDVYCRTLNLFTEVEVNYTERNPYIQGNQHYYGMEECDRMIKKHGQFFTQSIQDNPDFGTSVYLLYTSKYEETTKNLIKSAFGIVGVEIEEIIGNNEKKVKWHLEMVPNVDFESRKKQLEKNIESENLAAYLKPILFRNDLDNWQTIQCFLANPSIVETISMIFSNFNLSKKPMVHLAKKEHDVEDALKIIGSVQKISMLEKLYKQIMRRSEKMEVEPVKEFCQLLILRQYLLFTIENMDDEHLKNNPELQNLIRQFGPFQMSNMLFDKELTADMLLMTMEDLEKYCQDLDKRQKLFRKHRNELENLLAKKLKSLFFSQELGMSDYHLEVKLPAKLIKMAGIKGFMDIARKHPLIMINFFNMETVDALLNAYVSEEEKNNEMAFDEEERRKILIMIDLIFFQLKLSANSQIEVSESKQENVLTNEEIEKMNKIERAKSEGMDIMMEWLDNSDMETSTMKKMMTKEEKDNHAKEIDEKASSAIGHLIIKFEEGKIPSGIEVGNVENANQSESWREKWRSEWRDLTMANKKGKENVEEEKGKKKNAVNVASSSLSSLQN